ncbi:myosin light chain [Cystoisospora suis]|uniref:Myosin light chain n=1 Tax=Cystoisospora suis TaxID=483139 RepID=A0A2C6KLS3_9APIC|nr:myosin light chain [Cystoisospora suis]
MNCGVSRKDLVMYWDENLQDRFPTEGSLRQLGIEDKSSIYLAMPPNFDINNIEFPVLDGEGKKAAEGAGAEGGGATALIEESAPASVDEGSALKKEFEKRAKKGMMPRNDVGNYARSLGYAPSMKEIASLPDKGVDFKSFQEFLAVAMHPDDTQESFKSFFSAFDTQATGDLSYDQVTNILQLWGDEPLTSSEAKAFCE